MESQVYQSRFSAHFNRLSYLGVWSLDHLHPPAKKLFTVYRFFVSCMLVMAIILQMMDLYVALGNLRKVTYNLCTSVIVVALVLKLLLLTSRKRDLNQLRMNLWRDSLKFNSEEDVAIQDVAYAQLRNMQKCFYVAAVVFLPTWIISSYFSYKWGPRQLAFAGYLPLKDPLDDQRYVPALTYQALSAVCIILILIEADMAMFSLILQMEAYYQILMKDILKLSDIYGVESPRGNKSWEGEEVNPCLKNERGRKALKLLIVRHLEIIKYTKHFEYIYNPSILLQIISGALLLVMNGLELSMFLQEMSIKIYFQSGYTIFIGIDIFLICYHLSRLSAESFSVGRAVYSTVWYKMNNDMRRGLGMMMLRSQNPPRITAGKLFLVDLAAYLHILRSIYSWLMLFRQLGTTYESK